VDYEMARKYYEMAVALKSAKAANHLGRIYSNGEGVTKDLQKAQMYYDMEKNLNLN
jgi:TPR repeat protein